MLSSIDHMTRVGEVKVQFETAKKALERFQSNETEVSKHVLAEVEEYKEMLQGLSKKVGAKLETANSDDHEKQLFDLTRDHLIKNLTNFENRLRQNELILLMAFFDATMKEIHRAILKEDPSLLKSDRQIKLGKLCKFTKDEIIAEEIEREVQGLDRKSPIDRCNYWVKTLDIDWRLEEKALPVYRYVQQLRNTVLHADPDAEVTDRDIDSAVFTAMAIPMISIMQAARRFPNSFTEESLRFPNLTD